MSKDELIEKILQEKADKDNKIDLNAYALGLADMFEHIASVDCTCSEEDKTGTVSVQCCNVCGKPDEDWWRRQNYFPKGNS